MMLPYCLRVNGGGKAWKYARWVLCWLALALCFGPCLLSSWPLLSVPIAHFPRQGDNRININNCPWALHTCLSQPLSIGSTAQQSLKWCMTGLSCNESLKLPWNNIAFEYACYTSTYGHNYNTSILTHNATESEASLLLHNLEDWVRPFLAVSS